MLLVWVWYKYEYGISMSMVWRGQGWLGGETTMELMMAVIERWWASDSTREMKSKLCQVQAGYIVSATTLIISLNR